MTYDHLMSIDYFFFNNSYLPESVIIVYIGLPM